MGEGGEGGSVGGLERLGYTMVEDAERGQVQVEVKALGVVSGVGCGVDEAGGTYTHDALDGMRSFDYTEVVGAVSGDSNSSEGTSFSPPSSPVMAAVAVHAEEGRRELGRAAAAPGPLDGYQHIEPAEAVAVLRDLPECSPHARLPGHNHQDVL
ncbi:unnamed protein product, partial [Discosporangium mesarthrocarpum]